MVDEPHDEDDEFVLFRDADPDQLDYAFDEMNIVELPMALLTRDTSGIYEIPLSADGQSKLVCANSSKYGLPNSLAPRVLLGMMWLWAKECSPDDQSFTFGLRNLVCNYMYPGRFDRYPPGGGLLKSVEKQINAVANSQIHTDRWWDNSLKGRREVNVSIIDGTMVLDKGGRNRPRVLKVVWGKFFWESLRSKYTKPIDARLVQTLERPLDLALYRLLDRQLAKKPAQRYANIVHLARYKLGMQGQKVSAGGRTASSYIANQLRSSLSRLSREQFHVRMTIDRSKDIFAVTFESIEGLSPEAPHEVRDVDPVAELVRVFDKAAHGTTKARAKSRIAKADRLVAAEWLETHGLERSKTLVKECIAQQKLSGNEPIRYFRGLRFYEQSALGSLEKAAKEREGQLKLQLGTRRTALWALYQESLREAFLERFPKKRKALEAEALERARKAFGAAKVSEKTVRQAAASELTGLIADQLDAMPEQEFRRFDGSDDELFADLLEHHGFAPWSLT